MGDPSEVVLHGPLGFEFYLYRQDLGDIHNQSSNENAGSVAVRDRRPRRCLPTRWNPIRPSPRPPSSFVGAVCSVLPPAFLCSSPGCFRGEDERAIGDAGRDRLLDGCDSRGKMVVHTVAASDSANAGITEGLTAGGC